MRICQLMHVFNLNLKWFFLTRSDHANLNLFSLMQEVGAVSVTFGFESGSNEVLKAMNKKLTVQDHYKAIRISKEAGLKIRGQIMVGFPGETEEDVPTS
jgi:anaerobic magnesium-protoporphyrin IX monomethyl ester cyclase